MGSLLRRLSGLMSGPFLRDFHVYKSISRYSLKESKGHMEFIGVIEFIECEYFKIVTLQTSGFRLDSL